MANGNTPADFSDFTYSGPGAPAAAASSLNMPWGQTALIAPPDTTAAAPSPQAPPVPVSGNPLPSPAPSATPTPPDQASGPMPLPPLYSQPANRGGVVKNALTRMFYGMGQAMLQHVGLPTDFEIQQSNYKQQLQANELALKQAQQAYQQSTVTFQDPRTGMVYQGSPATMQRLLPAAVQGGYRTDVENLANLGRYNVEQMKALINAQVVKAYKDSIDENGNPGVQMLNEFGIPMGFVPGAVARSLQGTTSSTLQHVQDQNGVWQVFTVPTTRRPIPAVGTRAPANVFPYSGAASTGVPSESVPAPVAPAPRVPPAVLNRVPPTSPAGQAFIGGGPQARPITGAGGQPLQGPNALTPVIGLDADGNQVMVPPGQAQTLGLTNVQKADANSVSAAMKARRWVTDLSSRPGVDPRINPQQAGITQLIDDLDKQGKLGPLAGRFNEFMAGTWGAGDPEYQALRTKLDLSNTLLANVHVGSRGGWNLIDGFKNLADARKLTGAALKSAYGSELDYVRRAQMLPSSPTGAQPGAGIQIQRDAKGRIIGVK